MARRKPRNNKKERRKDRKEKRLNNQVESSVDTTLQRDRARGEELLEYLRNQGLLDAPKMNASAGTQISLADTSVSLPRVNTDLSALGQSISQAESNYQRTLQRDEAVKGALSMMSDNLDVSGPEAQAMREKGRRELDTARATSQRAIRTSGATGNAQAAAASYLGRDIAGETRRLESDLLANLAEERGRRMTSYTGAALSAQEQDRSAQSRALDQLVSGNLNLVSAQNDIAGRNSDIAATESSEQAKRQYTNFLAEQSNQRAAQENEVFNVGQDQASKAAAIQAILGGQSISSSARAQEQNRRDSKKLQSIAGRGY